MGAKKLLVTRMRRADKEGSNMARLTFKGDISCLSKNRGKFCLNNSFGG